MLQPEAMQRGRIRKAAAWTLVDARNVNRAALLHATSEQEATALRALEPKARIEVVPNGVDLSAAHRASRGYRSRLGIPDNAFVVLFLGRMHRIKRLDLLADAFAAAHDAHPSMHLVLAGPDEHGLIPELLERLPGAVGHVHAIGAIHGADKWSLVKDADVMVQCSDSESFGMSVVESLACGVPAIVTRTCPWGEIETNGCGFWIEQTAPAIASAIRVLASDPVLRSRMGERGEAFAHDRYSWDAIAPRMARLYADLT
jgi:glycosyltransferase involved in cell wall biosynthesis